MTQRQITQAVCDRLTRAVREYREGRSSYLEIVVPYRHGKSDMSSRYLPAWFLGQFPDAEVMLGGLPRGCSQGRLSRRAC